ncbi:Fibrinogen gamma chain [Nibea albiflora]|uniref:Fibrinogen gamma chain n=1 Tax=Nibea albiflora TaxID=240163 RepID=A0ACB7FJN0_NIBAL|nr:Fibrinogen gamma chain [Nibea albiflora]
MAPSLLATAGGLLLLFSFSSAGRYCPTTCGVADYLMRYRPGVTQELDDLQRELETIANLTQGAEQTVVYMKDSTTSAQKSSPQDSYIKKSSSVLDDVVRFEKTIIEQERQLFELQGLLQTNERRMTDLKQLSNQLQQKCNQPCKEEVEIEPTKGTDCQDVANKGATKSGLYYIKPAKATEQFLVYCEIDSFGRGFTVIQRRRDGSVDFSKDWIQYKNGFGYLSPDDTTEYADYNMFRIGSEADMYRLTYGFYFAGDAGDAFDGFDFGDDPSDKFYTSHNGMQFSTVDKDNDKYDGNCAQQDGSGWWMNRCHAAHLNGKYYPGGRYTEKDAGEFGFDNGIIWVTWHNRWYSLKETTMKLIPLNRITAGGQQSGIKDFAGLGDSKK